MNRRDLAAFLLLECASVVVVIALFALLDHRTAGLVAGAIFILLGAGLLFRSASWPDRFRSATFWATIPHLAGTSVPMVVTRLLSPDVPFHESTVLGLPGPVFHRVATAVFGLLVAATLVDLVRSRNP